MSDRWLGLLALGGSLLAGAIALGATAWAAGWLAWGRRRGALVHPLDFCLGLALLAHAALLLAASGALRVPTLLALALVLHLAAGRGWRQAAARLRLVLRSRRDRARAGAPALALLPALLPAALIAALPPHAWDETTYHLAFVRSLATSGSVGFLEQLRVPVFPQLHEALQAALLLLAGQRATHLVPLTAMASTGWLLWRWGREAGGRGVAWLAVGLFAGSPLVVYLAGIGYVEGLLTMSAAAAGYAVWRGTAAGLEGENGVTGWWVAAGWLAGSAAAIKYLGLFAIAGLGAWLWRCGGPRRARRAAWFLLAAGLAAGPTYLWIGALTGNPTFPFFASLFGDNPWSLPLGKLDLSRQAARVVALPWTAAFARHLAGLQPPLTPMFLLLPLIGWGALRSGLVRWLGAASLALVPVLMAVPIVDVRYLVPVLPWLALALALTLAGEQGLVTILRRPRPAAALALLVALPGWLYGPFYLWRAGGLPLTSTDADRFLAAEVTGYRALRWLERRTAGRHSLYGFGTETLHGLAHSELRGELSGPWRYSHLSRSLAAGDARRLACILRSLGSTHLLAPRRAAQRLGDAPSGPLRRIYRDAEVDLFALSPAGAYISTCMPSSTTRFGGSAK